MIKSFIFSGIGVTFGLAFTFGIAAGVYSNRASRKEAESVLKGLPYNPAVSLLYSEYCCTVYNPSFLCIFNFVIHFCRISVTCVILNNHFVITLSICICKILCPLVHWILPGISFMLFLVAGED